MADYSSRYKLLSIQATLDGSGMCLHDIVAEASLEGTGEWVVVPGLHKQFCLPAAKVQEALAVGTNNQIVEAYKDTLIANLETKPVPNTGWDKASIDAKMKANADAAAAVAAALDFIQNTLGLSLPVPFNI